MDKFGVPKTVNRHVLKAIYVINNTKSKSPQYKDILRVVRTSMKNNMPVKNLTRTVLLSLRNMSQLGLIKRRGTSFSVPLSNSKPCGRKIENENNYQTNKGLLGLNLVNNSSSLESITAYDTKMLKKQRKSMNLNTRKPDFQKTKRPLVLLKPRRIKNQHEVDNRGTRRGAERLKRSHSKSSISDYDMEQPKRPCYSNRNVLPMPMPVGEPKIRTLRSSHLANRTRGNLSDSRCRRAQAGYSKLNPNLIKEHQPRIRSSLPNNQHQNFRRVRIPRICYQNKRMRDDINDINNLMGVIDDEYELDLRSMQNRHAHSSHEHSNGQTSPQIEATPNDHIGGNSPMTGNETCVPKCLVADVKTAQSGAMGNRENEHPGTLENNTISSLTIGRAQSSTADKKLLVETLSFRLDRGVIEARRNIIPSNCKISDIRNIISFGVIESKNFVKKLLLRWNSKNHKSVDTESQIPVSNIKKSNSKIKVKEECNL